MGRICEGIKEYCKCGKEMGRKWEGNYENCMWEGNGKEIISCFGKERKKEGNNKIIS